MGSSLYAKCGLIRLSGQYAPVNDYYGVEKGNFHKVSPFFAVGLSKNIKNTMGIVVEFSHALKSTKKVGSINVGGDNTPLKIRIARSNLRVMLTFDL